MQEGFGRCHLDGLYLVRVVPALGTRELAILVILKHKCFIFIFAIFLGDAVVDDSTVL